MADWRHKAVCLVISFAKVVKILDVGKSKEQMYKILREEWLIMWQLWGFCTDKKYYIDVNTETQKRQELFKSTT